MSWLKKDSGQDADPGQEPHGAQATEPLRNGQTAKKGRPTPKRRDAQARGVHPVVPADRKAAKKEARRRQDEAWARQREAMITGDERYLPARDKGPVKRYIRDYLDARYSVGELFLPATLALLLILIGFQMASQSLWAAQMSFILMFVVYGVFIVSILDAVWAWWRVKARLREKFGEERVRTERGIFWYVFSRCFNLRRWRQPAPQVARRQFPS